LPPDIHQLERGQVEDLDAVISAVGDKKRAAPRGDQQPTRRVQPRGLKAFVSDAGQDGLCAITGVYLQDPVILWIAEIDRPIDIDRDSGRTSGDPGASDFVRQLVFQERQRVELQRAVGA
jgi:hypothetical protein